MQLNKFEVIPNDYILNPKIPRTIKNEVQVGKDSSLKTCVTMHSDQMEGSSSHKKNAFSSDFEMVNLTYELGLSINILTSESEDEILLDTSAAESF